MLKTLLTAAGVMASGLLLGCAGTGSGSLESLATRSTIDVHGVPCYGLDTSGRLPRDHTCFAGGNRVKVYTREDIERTGQTDVAQALRMLDPSIY